MERSTVVTDASVVVKWYLEEEYSKEAEALRNQFVLGNIELAAPHHMPFEVLNALRYSRTFSSRELWEVAESIYLYGIALHELRGEYARQTMEIATSCKVSVYDAAYVALAKVLNGVVYTADEKLISSLPSELASICIHVGDIPREWLE